uniref:SMP-LTD domain-containing protein n=1 Tax=Ditylenchus dipsaci TaxID=166011 RepID=A0A915DLU3_9BILA
MSSYANLFSYISLMKLARFLNNLFTGRLALFSRLFIWPTMGLYIAVTAFLYLNVADFKSAAANQKKMMPNKQWHMKFCKKVEQDDGVLGTKSTEAGLSVHLHGHKLHINHHQKAVRRYTFYDDPTLTEPEPEITHVQVCDLTNAKIKLRPLRLSARRWFSRKYPIMVKLTFEPVIEEAGKEVHKKETKPIQLPENEIVVEDIQDKGADFVEERRTIANIQEIANDAEEIDGKFEMEDQASCASDDMLVVAPSSQSKSGSSRTIWLFARNGREKEIWFHKLRKASKEFLCPTEKCDIASGISVQMPSIDKIKEHRDYYLYLLQDVEFSNQLNQIKDEPIIRSDQSLKNTVLMDLGYYQRTQFEGEKNTRLTAIFNLLAVRICYDFARDDFWVGLIRERVQMKIGAVHLPYFIESLKLEKFDLGTAVPNILKVYAPMLDQWGIWLDFDIKYDGLVQLTIVTQADLTKLNDENTESEDELAKASYFGYSDLDLPLSPEDEPDDEDYGKDISEEKLEEKSKKKPGRKIMKIIDKITHSDLFKSASELKLVRKAMEEISDTQLVINVEITELQGTMMLNIPPPPSDRLWYGFRETPKMSVKVVPQVGEKSVNFSAVSDLIEAKLVNIIQNLLVFPNLDDIVVPLLSGNDLLHGSFTK